MGIPSYFSYIVKQHREIIKQITSNQFNRINNLYIDSNSIVYDIVNELNKSGKNANANVNPSEKHNNIEQLIIDLTFEKIKEYIRIINPSNNVFIAFDGVAPVAKLKQQRRRRYLSWFQTELLNKLKSGENCSHDVNISRNNIWETINITPGTKFMNDLKIGLNTHFNNYRSQHPSMNIILSCSDEYGEGEHKIYQYIRNNAEYHRSTNTIIYGLDADLIMLSLVHLNVTENIYLFRETPHFIKYIDNSLNPNELYVMDIPLLGQHIIRNMNMNMNSKNISNKFNLVFDYILICFMLGNDFMPHFPSINIRGNGIDILLNAYKRCGKQLTNGKIIFWRNLRGFINILASIERENMIKEVEHLNKYNPRYNRQFETNSQTQQNDYENDLLNLPSKSREIENYINPSDDGWEYRYYKSLFNIEIDDVRRKQICINYLEGLEWTSKYYSSDCKNWRWKYNYDYAPLLSDLINYIPYFDTNFIDEESENSITPINELTQLCYVLPNKYLKLLPDTIRFKLLQEHPEWYSNNFNIKWAFCKYFWESNIDLCDINISELENILI